MPSWLLWLKRPLQIGFAAALLTALFTLTMPNYYRSEARILPVDAKGSSGGLGNLAAAAAAFGVNVPGGDSTDANFVDILGSRWLQERLLRTEFEFKQRTWAYGGERQHKETLYDYLDTTNMDKALTKLAPLLGIGRDLKSKVIFLSMESRSPELSQEVVVRSIQLLEEFVQQKGQTRGGSKAAFAEARMKDAREEMASAEEAFRRFLEGNRNYLASADPSVRLQGARLEAELKLRQQLLTTIAMSREQALMEEKNDMPILNVMDAGNLPIDKSRPARSMLVMAAFLLAAAGAGAWLNRAWILARLPISDDLAPKGPTSSMEHA